MYHWPRTMPLARTVSQQAQSLDEDDPLDWEERSDDVPFWRHAIAGSCAGIAEHVGMYPLDTIKTRIQASGQPVGIRDTVRAIASETGYRGFFRGASAIGMGCIPAHCGLFMAFEFGKDKILEHGNAANPMRMAMCGALASTVHDVIITPTDVIKQRLQLGCYNGSYDCVRTMLRNEGLQSLYRSLPVTLISNVPNTAVLVAVNESLKNSLGLSRRSKYSDLPWFCLCAGVGGAAAAAATLPLDVVKTRLQTEGACGTVSSVRDIVTSLWRMEGLLGFYKGFVPRLLLATPAATMCWGTYEVVQSLLCHTLDDEVRAAKIALSKVADTADVAAAVAGFSETQDDPFEWEHWDPLAVPLWKHVVAGSSAGIMEHVAMYPVDTVKTQMQAVPVEVGQPPPTVREVVRKVLHERGAMGLFRGCTAIGAACIPAHVGLFGTYELSKSWLLKAGDEKEHAPLKAACCGAVSTMVHDSIIVPMDVVKQRLQLGCYRNAYHCVTQTLKHEGVLAFYRSLPSTLVMECPFYAILVACNESLKLTLHMEGTSRSQQRSGVIWHFASAGISGIVASALTQPLDVVKTRLQTQEVHHYTGHDGDGHGVRYHGPTGVRYHGLFSTFSSIYNEEGVRGYYRGMLPRMVFAAPAAALCWGTYEAVKTILSNIDHSQGDPL